MDVFFQGTDLLGGWRRMLMEFTLQHHRAPTHKEWGELRKKWEHWQQCLKSVMDYSSRPQEVLLAAAGDTTNAALREGVIATREMSFRSRSGDIVVKIVLPPQNAENPNVYLRMETASGENVAAGRVFFPAIERELVMDEYGQACMPLAEYKQFLALALNMECSVPDGEVRQLELV